MLGSVPFVAVAVAVVVGGLLLGPLLVWLAWNVLDLAARRRRGRARLLGARPRRALPRGRPRRPDLIVAVVFLIDPAWLHRSATLHWPAPTLRTSSRSACCSSSRAPRRTRTAAAQRRRQADAGVATARGAGWLRLPAMRCHSCGTENEEGRKFCGECGAPLAFTCAACGTSQLAGHEVLRRVRRDARAAEPTRGCAAARARRSGASARLGPLRRPGRVHDGVGGARCRGRARAALALLRHVPDADRPLRRHGREVHRRRRHGGVGRAGRDGGRRRAGRAGRARPGRRGRGARGGGRARTACARGSAC